jgi:hypothetical protein
MEVESLRRDVVGNRQVVGSHVACQMLVARRLAASGGYVLAGPYHCGHGHCLCRAIYFYYHLYVDRLSYRSDRLCDRDPFLCPCLSHLFHLDGHLSRPLFHLSASEAPVPLGLQLVVAEVVLALVPAVQLHLMLEPLVDLQHLRQAQRQQQLPPVLCQLQVLQYQVGVLLPVLLFLQSCQVVELARPQLLQLRQALPQPSYVEEERALE